MDILSDFRNYKYRNEAMLEYFMENFWGENSSICKITYLINSKNWLAHCELVDEYVKLSELWYDCIEHCSVLLGGKELNC